ncbi:MAG: acyl carrier protein [Cyanobacteria bacterium SID2]|nr:acyl carrier protein [Cyanobacteria bacterium SID2]MBP0004267.1 acyl carrier protein [Cyanobacteria bacterium SBC]
MQVQNSNFKLVDFATEQDKAFESLKWWLIGQIAEQLSLEPNSIDVSQPLTRYGLDSIDAVTLVGELEDGLEVELPSTLFWDYPTIESCAQYLIAEFDILTTIDRLEDDDDPDIIEDLTETLESANTSEPVSRGLAGFWGRLGK